MLLSVFDWASWSVCLQRFSWTLGSLLLLVLIVSLLVWVRCRPHRFEPWAWCGLLAIGLGGLAIGVEAFLTPRRRGRRWWRWLGLAALVLISLDWWLPIALALLTTVGVGLLLQIVFERNPHL